MDKKTLLHWREVQPAGTTWQDEDEDRDYYFHVGRPDGRHRHPRDHCWDRVRNALKHCAQKPDSKVAVIYFPEDNFNAEEFNRGLARFNGLKGTSQYRLFHLIYCVHGERIIQIKKPSI